MNGDMKYSKEEIKDVNEVSNNLGKAIYKDSIKRISENIKNGEIIY